jgi:hypothetical protein
MKKKDQSAVKLRGPSRTAKLETLVKKTQDSQAFADAIRELPDGDSILRALTEQNVAIPMGTAMSLAQELAFDHNHQLTQDGRRKGAQTNKKAGGDRARAWRDAAMRIWRARPGKTNWQVATELQRMTVSVKSDGSTYSIGTIEKRIRGVKKSVLDEGPVTPGGNLFSDNS